MNRFNRLRSIQQLDPVKDNCQICRFVSGYEFPWDMTRSLEIALFRTFCSSSIGTLLAQTGELIHSPQKRYDDTGLIVSSILKWGHDSEQGQAAIARMNRIHSYFPISNEDFIYVLSTFIYEPIRWIDRFGWRKLVDLEKQSLFYFWYCVGRQMNIKNIPSTYDALEQYNVTYEENFFCYSPATQRVGEATINLFLSWFPAVLRPALKPRIYALLDDRMLDAFGFPHPTEQQRNMVKRLLRVRGQVVRYLPSRDRSNFFVDQSHRSYPQGFTLSDIGPTALLSKLNQRD